MVSKIIFTIVLLSSVVIFSFLEYNGKHITNAYKEIISYSVWKDVDIVEEKYPLNSEISWMNLFSAVLVGLSLPSAFFLGLWFHKLFCNKEEDYGRLEELVELIMKRKSRMKIESDMINDKIREMEKNQFLLNQNLCSYSCQAENEYPHLEDNFLIHNISEMSETFQVDGNSSECFNPECIHRNNDLDPEIIHQFETSPYITENIFTINNTDVLYSSSNKTTNSGKKEISELELNDIEEEHNTMQKTTKENNLSEMTSSDDINTLCEENEDEEYQLKVVKEEHNLKNKIIKENNVNQIIYQDDIYPIEIQVEQCPLITSKEVYENHSEINKSGVEHQSVTILDAVKEKSSGEAECDEAMSCRTSQSCRIPQIQKHSNSDMLDHQSRSRRNKTPKNFSSSSTNVADGSSVKNRRKKQWNPK